MRCLGILSVREETDERNKGRIKVLEKERVDRGISVVVAEFSASLAELRDKTGWRKRRLLKRGEKFLCRLGADAVALTKPCGEVFGIPVSGGMTVETGILPREMPKALEDALISYQESPRGKTGWVLDRTCSDVCMPLLGAMSQKVQYLGIATENRQRAEELEELLCEEYGVNLEILPPGALRERDGEILADVDRGRIAFGGETVLDGKLLSWDLRDYQVDLENLLKEHPKLWEGLSFQGWCKRKSG